MKWQALVTIGIALFAKAASADLMIIGWNMESGDADPALLASQMEDVDGCDVWGLCEVRNSDWATTFAEAAAVGEGASFGHVLGTTGGADRLQIIYDSDRFDLTSDFELHHINTTGSVRAPLVASLKEKGTDLEFLFVVNHLYRSKSDERHQQATLLNEWAAGQSLPVIAVGDYNFDWEVDGGDADHDLGYDNMIAGGTYRWVRPPQLVKTQCSDRFDSVLDFIFVAGDAQNWQGTSEILFAQAGYCPDSDEKSDHRPIRAIFSPAATEIPGGIKGTILARIAAIENELVELRALVTSLPE